MPIVLKSGSLNHLETSEPVQACNGIVLNFTSGFKITIAYFVVSELHVMPRTFLSPVITRQALDSQMRAS